MLIYYRFNNFCSFYCESEFSMCAPTGKVKKRFPDTVAVSLFKAEKQREIFRNFSYGRLQYL